MRNAVSNTRLKMLPSMVQKRYGESKGAYDRGDFTAAKIGFKWVLSALADPDIASLAAQSPLADIKTLAAGFVDLSDKALAPPPPPPVAAVVAALPPAPVAVRDLQRVFSTEDSDVVAPVTTRQTMPRFPGLLKEPASGLLELVIDATGAVESVRVLKSVHPQYDPLIVSAARKWQYQPALLDGTAVKYSKRIQISLAPSATSTSRP
jgi:TonB family protein